MVVAIVPTTLFVLWFREDFSLPAAAATFGYFLLSVVMTGLLQFFLSYTMALLAFWMQEVSTVIFILFAFEYIASGHLFPLDILPPTVEQVLRFTPFPVPALFSGEHLAGPHDWRGGGAGVADPGRLGRGRLSSRALGLEPGHPQILGGGRMK